MNIRFIGILLLLPAFCFSTDLEPWFESSVVINAKNSYYFQSYNHIDGCGCTRLRARDSFDTLSAGINYDIYAAELELTLAQTHHRNFGFDNARLTGRYQLMNDVLADPFSLIAGLTLTQCCTESLNDISSFHHGLFEAELHVSAGKETSCEQFWETRYWGILGIGIADRGSPWLRFNVHWERNWWDRYQFRAYIKTLWGFGGDCLKIHHFRGYGPIDHQSVDLGIRYDYLLEWLCGAIFSLSYEHRVYAQNFPEHTNVIMARISYQFGLDKVKVLMFWE